MPFEAAKAEALDQSQPIVPQLHRLMRERIVQGDLKPGHRVSESEIAAHYDVSRQPVREAFIRLASEGLLMVRPQRATVVSKIDYSAVLDSRFLREAIEADIVRLLTSRPDPALLDTLRDQIGHQRAAATRSPQEFMHLDDLFHRTLAAGAGKDSAWRLIEGLKSQMDRVRYLSIQKFPAEKLLRQHTALVDMIASGNQTGADTAIRTHLREVLADLPKILNANPDFFELPAEGVPQPVNTPIQGGNDT